MEFYPGFEQAPKRKYTKRKPVDETPKYTLGELMEALQEVKIVNPYHIELTEDGRGEFPDTYKLTRVGAKRLEEQLIQYFKNPITWI